MHKTELKVSLGMGLTHSSVPGGDRWRLEARDDESGVVLFTMLVPLDVFAAALGTRVMPGIPVTIPTAEGFAKLGQRHEVRSVLVSLPKGAYGEEATAAVRDAATALEVDGWKWTPETFNMHRYRGDTDTYKVSLHRWVDPSTPPYVDPPEPSVVRRPAKRRK